MLGLAADQRLGVEGHVLDGAHAIGRAGQQRVLEVAQALEVRRDKWRNLGGLAVQGCEGRGPVDLRGRRVEQVILCVGER